MPGTDTCVLTDEELALFARVTDATTLFGLDEPPLDTHGWHAVLHSLEARGMITREGEELSISPAVAPVIGVALFADCALEVSYGTQSTGSRTLTFLRAGTAVVEHEHVTEGLHRFTTATVEEVAARTFELANITDARPDVTGPPIEITVDAFVALCEQLQAGDAPGALALIPQAQGFVHALGSARSSVIVTFSSRGSRDTVATSGFGLVDGGPDCGMWLRALDPSDPDRLIVQQVAPAEARRRMTDLLMQGAAR